MPLRCSAAPLLCWLLPPGVKVPFVRSLESATVRPEETDIWPAYRLIDNAGVPVDASKPKPHEALG